MIFEKFLYYECICLYDDKKVILLLKLFFVLVFYNYARMTKQLCKITKVWGGSLHLEVVSQVGRGFLDFDRLNNELEVFKWNR